MGKMKKKAQRLNIVKNIVKGIILICAVLWGWNYFTYQFTVEDRSAIDSLYIEFEGYVRENDFEKAYEFISPVHKRTLSFDKFVARFHVLQQNKELRLHPQRKLWFKKDTGWLFPKNFPKYGWNGIAFEFEKFEGKWYLTGEIRAFTD